MATFLAAGCRSAFRPCSTGMGEAFGTQSTSRPRLYRNSVAPSARPASTSFLG